MSVVTTCLDISVPATLESVRSVRRNVAEIAEQEGASRTVVEDIRLCVGEAVTNAVVHAYDDHVDAAARTVDVTVERAQEELIVVVADRGRGLIAFRQDGSLGYGLKLIERLATRYLISSAQDAGTELRMVFALRADST